MSNKKNTYFIVPNLRIAISGFSGCGNTTVSKLLASTLQLPIINYTFKNLAKEMNISFSEIVERAKTDFSFDKIVDTKQVEMARQQACILASRLAIWFLPEAQLKIFLRASEDTRAQRIQQREGGDLEEVKRFTLMRDNEDTRRYKELYNIDNTEYSFADLVIDTDVLPPKKIVSIILDTLLKKNLIVQAP